MTQPGTHNSLIYRNVLVLDGGGVRGLSSLLILKALMMHVNTVIQETTPDTKDLDPHDIFDLVSGTSTGGLIAIMIGKLGMTLEECIQAYYKLSRIIFGRKQFIGMLTHGLAALAQEKWTKHTGRDLENCINTMLQEKGFGEQTRMVATDGSNDSTACAVVCKERIVGSTSACRRNAVLICSSYACHEMTGCLVSEAARATSAAPTYFPPQTIGERRFVDGAIGFNNPSFVTYLHYTQWNRVAGTRGRSVVPGAGSPDRRHGGIDWSKLRLVNLGTGDKSEAEQPRQNDDRKNHNKRFKWFRELIGIAFNTDDVVTIMEVLASTDVKLKYERFSAANELSNIKMDDYEALDEIRSLTEAYLDENETQIDLRRVAEEIASEYLQRHGGIGRVPAISVTSAAPVANPASPLERIPAVDALNTGDITPVRERGHDVTTGPALHVLASANSSPMLLGTPSRAPLPDLVHSSGRTTLPTASAITGTNPRTPTSSSPLMKKFKNFIPHRMKSPFQSKSKNLSGDNDSHPTQMLLTDPSASAEPQETGEQVFFPNAGRRLFPDRLGRGRHAETSRPSQENPFN